MARIMRVILAASLWVTCSLTWAFHGGAMMAGRAMGEMGGGHSRPLKSAEKALAEGDQQGGDESSTPSGPADTFVAGMPVSSADEPKTQASAKASSQAQEAPKGETQAEIRQDVTLLKQLIAENQAIASIQ